MLNAQAIRTLFADAYYQAAAAGAYMRTTTEMLEALRTELEAGKDIYFLWVQMDKAIGQTLDNEPLLNAIQQLKNGFIALVYEQQKEKIQMAFAESEAKGWVQWLQTFAEGLAAWKEEIYEQLSVEDFPFAAVRQETVDLIKKTVPLILQERWIDSEPLFAHLAEQESLSAEVRMKFWATTGQIQLYHLLNNEKALADFEQAKALVPEHSRVERSFGEYYLRNADIEKARQHFQKALQLDPEDLENYQYMGDTYSEEGKSVVAAEWYRDALRKNPGNPDAYSRLITLCGKPDYFTAHASEMADWVTKMTQLEPKRAFSAHVDAGYAFQRNEQWTEAEQWFKKAIEIAPERLNGYLNLGYLYRDWKKFDAAEQVFYKVIELYGDNFDAYWELGWLYQNQEQWQKSLEAFEKSRPLRPEWEHYVLNEIGNLHRTLNNIEAAETAFLASLQLNPDDFNTVESLNILQNHWKTAGNWERALQLLQKVRTQKGESYEAEFQNRLGIHYYEQQDYARAIEHYQKALQSKPDDPVQNDNIGLAYEAAGRMEEAVGAYEKAWNSDSDNLMYLNRLGTIYFRQNQFDKAKDYYQQAVAKNEKDPTSWENLGLAQEQLQQFTEAEAAFQKALELESKQKDLYYNRLGIFFYNQQRHEEAVHWYEKAIAASPNSIYLENAGLSYEQLGQLEAAKAAYEKALALANPSERDLYLNRLGIFCYTNHQYDNAIEYYQEAIEAQPKAIYYENLGLVYSTLKQTEPAVAAYSKAIEINPMNATPYNSMGYLHFYNDNPAEALPFYQKAAALTPQVAIAHENVGIVLEKLGRLPEAIQAYQQAIEVAFDSEKHLFYNRLGVLYYNQYQTDLAIEHYQQALQLEPNHLIYLDNLALAYEQAYRTPEAEQTYLRALDLSPDKDQYYTRLGKLYLQTNDEARALEYFEEAVAFNPKVALYYDNLGFVFERRQAWDKAIVAYKRAIQLDPNNSTYYTQIGGVLLAAQRFEEAITWFEKAVRMDATNFAPLNNLLQAVESLSDRKNAIAVLQELLEVPGINRVRLQEALADFQKDLSDAEPNVIS